MDIKYGEVGGRIQVSYALEHNELQPFPEQLFVEGGGVWLRQQIVGFVPKRMERESLEAIQKWSEQKCRRHAEQMLARVTQKYAAQEKRMTNAPRPLVAVLHSSGTVLKGRVGYEHRFYGYIELVEPFKLENTKELSPSPRLGWGPPVFEWSGHLTKEGEVLARAQLVRLYDAEMRQRDHGSVIKLVEDLNEEELRKLRKKRGYDLK